MSESDCFRFGAFEFDAHSGELRKYGLRLKVQGKPADLLSVLLQHAGEVVLRDDIIGSLWPDDTTVDFEHGIGLAIHRLRRAMGDDPERPRYIETLPRRGFRFIAAVERTQRISSRSRTVLVLPFRVAGSGRARIDFADGLTEEAIAHLGRAAPARLAVIAPSTSFAYKGAQKTGAAIGSELGAQYVIEGSVRWLSGRVRVRAQLTSVTKQTQIWSENFESMVADAFEAEAELGEAIARSVAVQLGESAGPKKGPGDSATYALYAQGRTIWRRRTEESTLRALKLFQQAIRKDPSAACAQTGIADCYSLLGYYGAFPPREAFVKAEEAARQALSLDESFAAAHSSLGFVLLQNAWDTAGCEQHLLRAIELNQNYAPAHHWYGICLTQMGRFTEALYALSAAERLDPLSTPVKAHIGRLYYFWRKYEQARALLEEVARRDPTYAPVRFFLALTLLAQGEAKTAAAHLAEGLRQAPRSTALQAALTLALYRDGKAAGGTRLGRRISAGKNGPYISPFFLAMAHLADDEEQMYSALDEAFHERFGWLFYLRYDAIWDAHRESPRFQGLLARLPAAVVAAAGN